MAAHLVDPDVDELAGRTTRGGEIDDPVALGAAHQLGAVLARRALEKDSLHAADAGTADRVALRLDDGLQSLQPLQLLRRRCAIKTEVIAPESMAS